MCSTEGSSHWATLTFLRKSSSKKKNLWRLHLNRCPRCLKRTCPLGALVQGVTLPLNNDTWIDSSTIPCSSARAGMGIEYGCPGTIFSLHINVSVFGISQHPYQSDIRFMDETCFHYLFRSVTSEKLRQVISLKQRNTCCVGVSPIPIEQKCFSQLEHWYLTFYIKSNIMDLFSGWYQTSRYLISILDRDIPCMDYGWVISISLSISSFVSQRCAENTGVLRAVGLAMVHF